MSKFRLRIITPDVIKVDEEVDMVILRSMTGDMGILPGHEAGSAVLDYGVLRILDDSGERRLAVYGGVAEIRNDVVTVLTSAAEWPDEINRSDAEEDLDSAKKRLESHHDAMELKDQVTVRRSLVRIEVSAYPLLNKSSESKG
ncbi:MAG: ATP synthase F1 subunit epsilon [Oscillospiraceae bacterium]|nr:ATP synthase F1 subunit epsilon [Oscillospiraceae bacterium]